MDKAEAKHERILEELINELRDRYGQENIRKHVEYHDNDGTLLGEFDVLVTTSKSVRIYEVKGSPRGFKRGECQMHRAQDNVDYWLENPDLNTHYTCISQDRRHDWVVTRH